MFTDGTSEISSNRQPTSELAVRYYRGSNTPREVFEFRKLVFVDRLEWDLTVQDRMERDEFDCEHTVYCTVKCESKIVGLWRVLNTTNPYLLADVFPTLMNRIPPRREDVIEVSRFGVDRSCQDVSTVVLLLLGALFSYAEKNDISNIVAVSDPAFERVLRRYRIFSRLFRRPQLVGVNQNGNVYAVAGELPLAKQNRTLIDYYIELADSCVEIPASSERTV